MTSPSFIFNWMPESFGVGMAAAPASAFPSHCPFPELGSPSVVLSNPRSAQARFPSFLLTLVITAAPLSLLQDTPLGTCLGVGTRQIPSRRAELLDWAGWG